jgi:hypothetical protein
MTAEERRGGNAGAVVGAILIVIGILVLAGQQLDIDWGADAWPLYIIAAGVTMLALGLTQAHRSGLTTAGSIMSVVGLILLYQNITDHWESWAYAWALVGPGGSGLGMLLSGTRNGNRKMARDGFWMILTALGIFAVGFIFFEGVIGISGDRLPLPDWFLPAVIIVLGVAVLVRGFMSGDRPPDKDAAAAGDGEIPGQPPS